MNNKFQTNNKYRHIDDKEANLNNIKTLTMSNYKNEIDKKFYIKKKLK